jgi:peptidoglycan-N-acetylmuramic acid deacetylase
VTRVSLYLWERLNPGVRVAYLFGALLAAVSFNSAALAQQDPAYSEVVSGDPASGIVALTFDAGTEAGGAAPRVLQILRDRGLHVTLFLSGHWVDHNAELAQQMVTDGHEIANHSYDHPDLTNLSTDQIVWELDYTDQVVSDVMGVRTRPYFRPPFGARNRRVLDVAAATGFRSIYWSLDSGDWLPRASAAAVAGKILRFAVPGDIVVEHLTSPETADALPVVLDEFEQRGWRVGTVSQVLDLTSPVETAHP